MKVVIIDDEASVRKSVIAVLKQNFDDIEVLAEASDVREGEQVLTKYKTDILFLDIEMPDGTGFDLLNRLKPFTFRVIFITGHQEYALKAIKVSALDYILKPVDQVELIAAVDKARQSLPKREEEIRYTALNDNLLEKGKLKKIILRSAEALQIVAVTDIIRAEADSNYTHFYIAGNRHILISRPLKEYELLLSGCGILRVHHSHLINLDYIDKFFRRDGGYLLLKDGTSIPVSSGFRIKVLQAINDHLYK